MRILLFFSHGTRCAGTAAAEANNEMCGVGVAYNSYIAGSKKKLCLERNNDEFCDIGIRVLDGPITTLLEARAITLFAVDTHIKSASWG